MEAMEKNLQPDKPAPLILILLICLVLAMNDLPADADPGGFGRETYFIDGQRVLLYKVINFWYTSLEGEGELFCGKPLSLKIRGMAVSHEADTGRLRLRPGSQWTEYLCVGDPALVLQRLHPGYFQQPHTGTVALSDVVENGVPVFPVDPETAARLRAMASELALCLQGTITGLANGKIALAGCGQALKTCGADPGTPSLKIIHVPADEILAEFTLN